MRDVDVHHDAGDGLQCAEDVAVPEQPLAPLQVRTHLGGWAETGLGLRHVGIRWWGRSDLARLVMTVTRTVMGNLTAVIEAHTAQREAEYAADPDE